MPDINPAQPDPYTQQLMGNYERNKGYAQQGSYSTSLNPPSEQMFRKWIAQNKVPFNPEAKLSDYDMRGFWLALQAKDPRAMTAVNPYDKQIHYPDYWKTPYHSTFSNESQWATKDAPRWNDKDQLVDASGKVIFDSRKAKEKK